ncbi:hypothetical protein [Pontimicrobium sp. MEBiC01747]
MILEEYLVYIAKFRKYPQAKYPDLPKEKALSKYLDELAELARKAKLYNFKTKKMLEIFLNEEKGIGWAAPLKVKYLNEAEKT